jgi:glycosyltransferase involved in cell wall biosynthesis
MSGAARVTFVVTDAITVEFLRDQLASLRRRGVDVTVVSGSTGTVAWAPYEGVDRVVLPMARDVRPDRDLISLVRLWRFFRLSRPWLVNASTPKAALLALIAARLARVPVRIYTLRGLRLETATGLAALVFRLSERTAMACAHRVVCVSESLRDAVVRRGLTSPDKTVVVADPGVDVARFEPTPERLAAAKAERHRLGLDPGTPLIGYAGRFTRDKGFPELLQVFDRVRAALPETRLVLLGHVDPVDPIGREDERRIADDPGIIAPGFVHDPAPWYRLMDVFVFPSHREGLGMAPLEAAAAELPVVGYRVTGVVDAVGDGVSGTLVPLGDVTAMAEAIVGYLRDPEWRGAHGRNGRRRVIERFSRREVLRALHRLYDELGLDGASGPLEEQVPGGDHAERLGAGRVGVLLPLRGQDEAPFRQQGQEVLATEGLGGEELLAGVGHDHEPPDVGRDENVEPPGDRLD